MNAIDNFIRRAGFSRLSFSDNIRIGPLSAYVRHGRHCIGSEVVDTFDIAKVDVDDGERGKGHFSAFLAEVFTRSPWPYLYVECVHEDRLATYLEREGWTRDPLKEDRCYYKAVG